MKLRLELLANNGRKLIAVEEHVHFHRSVGETLAAFNLATLSLVQQVVRWLAKNQEDFVKVLEATND